MKRITYLLIAFIIFISTVSMPVLAVDASDYYSSDEYHADLDYADMEIVWVDEEAVAEYLDEFEQDIKSGTDEDVIAGYDKIFALIDYADTMYQLNEIRYNKNIYNDEYADLSADMLEYKTDLADRAYALYRDALNSSHADALKAHINDEDLVDSLLEYEELTDEQRELISEYDDLTREYDRLVMGDIHVMIDGEDWSFEKINSDPYMGYEEYMEKMSVLYEHYNAGIAPIYIKIVKNLNRRAEIEGYDNFADYAYENIYNRDYTTEDIRGVYDDVREYIVPLHDEFEANDIYNYKLEKMSLSGEERLARVAPVIEKIHPDLMEAWNYMIDHGLYDLDASPSKMDVGYTVPLFVYGSAFIYDRPYENWKDIETVVHEFGHYNEAYHADMHEVTYIHNVDVGEIHSQALELLCLDYADELYGQGCAEAVRNKILCDMTESVIDGCVFDEFQYRAFTYEGELTVDELNNMYMEICNSYGYGFEEGDPNVYAWVGISHTFESPMYYISYATSALAALDLFAMSVDNRQAAIDCYMHLTTYHGVEGFRETLDDVGLPDIFEDGVIEDISIAVKRYGQGGILSMSYYQRIYVICASVFVLFILIIVIIAVCRKPRIVNPPYYPTY